MAKLTKEIMETLNDPETLKVLTTTDEKGIPHTVVKDTLKALDSETIAYMELIESSRTSRNILRNLWDKKLVAITLFNVKERTSYQIKGQPYRLMLEGPIWDQFLGKIWDEFPESDPAGVWLIKTKEIINQNYEVRLAEEMKRFHPGNYSNWRRFLVRKKR